MRPNTPLLALVVMDALASVGALAAEDASFSKDLAATIALQGLPCDKVVSALRNGDRGLHGNLSRRQPLPRLRRPERARGHEEPPSPRPVPYPEPAVRVDLLRISGPLTQTRRSPMAAFGRPI